MKIESGNRKIERGDWKIEIRDLKIESGDWIIEGDRAGEGLKMRNFVKKLLIIREGDSVSFGLN